MPDFTEYIYSIQWGTKYSSLAALKKSYLLHYMAVSDQLRAPSALPLEKNNYQPTLLLHGEQQLYSFKK
jgi:hypothetical protein